MISVGSREGRKVLEQGYSSNNNVNNKRDKNDNININNRVMEESEIEEGEACSYHDDDPSIDPDVALSYIDEKLQNVLGHFKKDFEGTVSAESLGAKFGTYGSFLPAYRRSPQSRSPARVQNHHTSQSPGTLPPEGLHNSGAAANAGHSIKHGYALVGSVASNAHKPPSSQKNQFEENAKAQSTQSVEESAPRFDPKTLKVRIKLGSDNLSVKKNAALYTGLGLDGSPSSFEASPMRSEGLPRGLPFDSFESPAQILQMMTSSPLHGGRFLSPLPEDLMQLSERPKRQQDVRVHSTAQSNQETFAKHSSYPVKDNMTFSEEKNLPSSGKKGLWLKDQRHRNDRHAGSDFALKDSDVDVVSCEELVSDALKLPLLADPDSIKRVSSWKENAEFDEGKRDLLESNSIHMSLSVKPNEKVKTAEESTDASHEMMAYSRNVDSKSEIANNFDDDGQIDLKSIHTSEKDLNFVKQRMDKSTKYVDGISSHGKEKLPSGGKRRKKKDQSHGYVGGKVSTGSTDGGVLVPKDKDNCDIKHTVSRSELEHSSLQKDLNKTRDAYVDIFGDMNDQDREATDSPNLLSRERLKAPDIVEKAALPFENPSKGRASSLEGHTHMNSDRKTSINGRGGSTSIRHLNGPSHNASVSENGCPISEATLFGAEPDEWVCCDQCQKWRLLPPGRKAADLPDSWICSMQTWLPDMNNCSFSDEVTNDAIRVRFQMLPEVPNSVHVSLDRLAAGSASADILNSAVSTDGKLKKSSRSSFQDSSRKPSLSQKKQQALKGRSVTDAKEYLRTKDQEFQHQTKSSDLYVHTNQYKKVRKHQRDSHSDGGKFKSPKIKSKREYEQDFPRTSKRSKTRSMQSGDNSQATSRDQVNGMLEVSSAYGLTADTTENDMAKYSEPISCILKDLDVKSSDTLRRFKGQVEAHPATESVHMFKSGSSDITPKKRKGDSIKDPPCSTPSSGKLMDDNDKFSRKKHRMSKSEGKESSASKRNGKADKKSKIISQRILNRNESFQKDSSVANVAATSSSSKVSGSLKVKSMFQEIKGSPVESVSSSPLRNSNFEKRGSGCRGILEKDTVQDAEKMLKGSPRKFMDDIHEVGDGLSWPIKKEEMETGTNKKVLESSMINVQNNGDSRADCKELDKYHPITAQNSSRSVNGRSVGDGDLDVTCGRDKYPTSIRYSGKGKFKMSQSYENPQDDVAVHEERPRVRKIKEENSESNVDKSGKDNAWSQEPSFRRCEGQQEHDEKRSIKMFDVAESGDLVSASVKEKSKCLLPSDGEKCDTSNNLQHGQGIGTSTSCTDVHPSDLPKEPWVSKKADSQTGNHLVPSKHSISNGHRIKDQEAPSPLRRDSSSHAASYALKEAKNLKHMADRVKNVDTMESIGLYFEAALKFLHGASLLESGKPENFKQRDVVQAMKIYRETAELCRFCAHEYEKLKDMATAALAYKCMEVAYMRVVYSSHSAASRDRCELQTVLHMVPPGESPSSSASDIDNLNNIANGDMTAQAKSADSPLLSGNLVIAAKNRPNFSRLLKFAEDMNAAMEASRKSRIASAAANDTMNQADPRNCIASIKRALDFNFHDVEGLLRLVRLAKDAISR